nr:DUF4244 domain-containing protein [Propionibacterium sp.]
MSEQYQSDTARPAAQQHAEPAIIDRARAAAPGRVRGERGMVTIEYAVGAVMVIALVAAIVVAIGQGWMGELTQSFAQFIFDQFKRALQLG